MMQTNLSDSNTLLVDPNDYDKHIKAMADACTQFFNAGLPITYCLQLNKIRTELECDKAHLEDIKSRMGSGCSKRGVTLDDIFLP